MILLSFGFLPGQGFELIRWPGSKKKYFFSALCSLSIEAYKTMKAYGGVDV
jgi:hypothetical protein